MPVSIHFLVARLPSRVVVWVFGVIDMQNILDRLVIEVVSNLVADRQDVFLNAIVMSPYSRMMLVPLTHVLVESVASLVRCFATVFQHSFADPAVLAEWVSPEVERVVDLDVIVRSVEIVPVKVAGKFLGLIPDSLAEIFAGIVFEEGEGSIEEQVASVAGPVLVDALRDQIEVLDDIDEGGLNIEAPVGGAVANDEALEVHLHDISVEEFPHLVHLVMLIDLPCQVRRIYSTIALT